MSRVAKNPIALPKGVEIQLSNQEIAVKGAKGELTSFLPSSLNIRVSNNQIIVEGDFCDRDTKALAGTVRANIANMVKGVSVGFERRLTLVGVGYRAQTKGDTLSLSLGFSHPIEFGIPSGITVETPSQTEILVKGCCRQRVGQIAANIRSYRPPEPYKGKGVRYSDEQIVRKEAKKK